MIGGDILTERLRLCAPAPRHVDQLPGVLNDPEIEANTITIPYPYTRRDAKEALKKFADWHEKDIGHVRFIELRASGELVGTVGFEFHDGKRRGELGYTMGRAWRGCGYVTEAASAMVDYGFRVIGFDEITAHAMVHNPASSRVLEKLRFEKVGVIKGACRKKDRAIDAHGYVMTRQRWMELQEH